MVVLNTGFLRPRRPLSRRFPHPSSSLSKPSSRRSSSSSARTASAATPAGGAHLDLQVNPPGRAGEHAERSACWSGSVGSWAVKRARTCRRPPRCSPERTSGGWSSPWTPAFRLSRDERGRAAGASALDSQVVDDLTPPSTELARSVAVALVLSESTAPSSRTTPGSVATLILASDAGAVPARFSFARAVIRSKEPHRLRARRVRLNTRPARCRPSPPPSVTPAPGTPSLAPAPVASGHRPRGLRRGVHRPRRSSG